ncbi:MAG TPA: GNAT family N-acetyltransferase [Anaerolineae bacterium]|nr:GNAT family N-acetyltransferase [Anaerolineae bacterium]
MAVSTLSDALTLTIIAGRDLSSRDRAAVIDRCSRAFEMDFAALFNTFNDPIHVLAKLDGVLVSHALWVTRWLQAGNGPLLRTAFVEAVATDPEYQGRGFATQVMHTLQAALVDYDLAGLSTGRPGFYARLGWQSWRGSLFVRTEVGPLATPSDSVMVLLLPRTPPLDLTGPLSAEWRVGELW